MQVANNTVVTVSYVVTDEEGQVVGRTDPKRPVVALIGHGYLVPGLEAALLGKEAGVEFALRLEPKDAFGEFNQGLVQTIDRSMFGTFPVEVGNAFEADTSAGPRLVVVKEVTDSTVTVDGNHPLAGKTLNFIGSIDEVREATEEEIAHGHAHRDGVCPSEEGEHHCCCGHHHHDDEEGGEHHCCHHHHHDDEEGGEHHCCHHHRDDEESGEHQCCGHHHHEDGEHQCCGHHHHEDGEHHCCGHHHHEDGEHHCHHHGEDGEHHCHHHGEDGEHHCHHHDDK